MSNTWILISFVITLVALILMLTKLKLDPTIGLLSAAILAGLLTRMPLADITSAISSGFGSTLSGLGMVVAFGCILAYYLEKSGAIDEMAKWLIRKLGPKNDIFALAIAGFIISIPVWMGAAWVMLAPLCKKLAKLTNKSILRYVCALSVGLLLTHCCVAPTPGPLAVAGMIGANIGWFIFYGIIVTLPALLIISLLYVNVYKKDEKACGKAVLDEAELAASLKPDPTKPSAGHTIFLIFFPVILIVVGTVSGIVLPEGTAKDIIAFISNNNIALFISMLVTIFSLSKYFDKPVMSMFNDALKTTEIVIILGVGGSLAAVITKSGIGDVLCSTLLGFDMPILVFAFILSAILRVALSSSTTAMLTTVGIFAPIAQEVGASPVLVGLTICAAAVGFLIHTDTAFWLAAGLFDIDSKQTLRSLSVPTTIASLITFAVILILSMFANVLPGLY